MSHVSLGARVIYLLLRRVNLLHQRQRLRTLRDQSSGDSSGSTGILIAATSIYAYNLHIGGIEVSEAEIQSIVAHQHPKRRS